MKKTNTKQKQPITIDYENKKLSIIYFLPLLLIAGFVPLIVHAKFVDLEGTTQALYWTGQRQYLDFFSYWKAQWVVVLTAIALIFYLILYKQKKLPFKNLKQYYIPLAVYALFVIISTIFAIDTQTALWGFVDMYQGMFVLLSYVLITFLTINFVNSERDVKLFTNAFTILMIIEGLLGITQYFGFDFFQTKLGNSLIIPGNLQVENLSFSFGPKTIYGTLFNTNFVGSFAALMLPLSVAFLLGAKTKKERIVSAIALVLMIFTWIGCNSRAGYLGVAVSTIFAFWFFRRLIIKHWKVSTAFALVLIVIFIGLNIASNGAIISRLNSFNFIEQIAKTKENYENSFKFNDILLGKNEFSLITSRQRLNLKIADDKLYFLDENNNELEIVQDGNRIKLKNNDKYWEINNITMGQNYPGVSIKDLWGSRTISFYFSQEGVKILGSGGRVTEPIVAKSYKPLEGLERFMSNRGYIWGRTIPMLSNYIIKGAGPDVYAIVFPQDDIIAKLNSGMDASMVIDKPHNMYLQNAVNTGVVSLIMLIIVWLSYVIDSLKKYSNISFNSIIEYIGATCFISEVGYLVAGMFNDQMTSVSPIFWIILGIGISINYRLNKTNNI